ncbi:MAG: polyprenyl synthetase family protein, partial [Planctomycetota bacterium]
RHSFRIGVKRLRPALLLLAAQANGPVRPSHRTLAAVVEMIHTATLVHDDVLDDADIRRHEETINARWSNQTSVLLGDYLFTHAFYLASTLDSTFGCRAIGRATNTVCEGELLQTASCGNFLLSRDEYFAIVEAKTAELCACCCLLGAHYAGADSPTVERFETFGRELGIAFQIADDLLDLEGDERAAGKSLGTDLANGKVTLPMILLREQLDERRRSELQELFETSDVDRSPLLIDWLDRSGALSTAREIAGGHAEKAASYLQNTADGQAKRALLQICEFVVNRSA